MNKKQLEKVLISIDNQIDNKIIKTLLTDNKFETILAESNYPIMKQVTIIFQGQSYAYAWFPTINGVYTNEDTFPYIMYTEKGKPFSVSIKASSSAELRGVKMDEIDIKDNADLCTYTIRESDESTYFGNPRIVDITIPNVTGDIYIYIYSEIPPM